MLNCENKLYLNNIIGHFFTVHFNVRLIKRNRPGKRKNPLIIHLVVDLLYMNYIAWGESALQLFQGCLTCKTQLLPQFFLFPFSFFLCVWYCARNFSLSKSVTGAWGSSTWWAMNTFNHCEQVKNYTIHPTLAITFGSSHWKNTKRHYIKRLSLF